MGSTGVNLRLPAPLKEYNKEISSGYFTQFTSTDQTLVGAKADSVVRGTQLFNSKHLAHHFIIKGITLLRFFHQLHLSFSYLFIYKATDENQTVHRESKKKPQKKEESQLQVSISMIDIRCHHQQEHLNSLDWNAGRHCPHSQFKI